jgi:ubiquitin C-terminal hydrolase
VGINKRGRTGLNNLGNTCFLSSGLQCLSHVVPLTSYFLSGEYRSDLNVSSKDGTRGQLADKYELLLRELWFGETASVSPLHIKGELGKKDSM